MRGNGARREKHTRGVGWALVTENDDSPGVAVWSAALELVAELLPEALLPIIDGRIFFIVSLSAFDEVSAGHGYHMAYFDRLNHMVVLRELRLSPAASKEEAVFEVMPFVIHELAHAAHIEWAHSKADALKYRKVFDRDLAGRHERGVFVTRYATTNYLEDFAENVMWLVIGGLAPDSVPAARLRVLGIDPAALAEMADTPLAKRTLVYHRRFLREVERR